jgi:hypothetical protein
MTSISPRKLTGQSKTINIDQQTPKPIRSSTRLQNETPNSIDDDEETADLKETIDTIRTILQ